MLLSLTLHQPNHNLYVKVISIYVPYTNIKIYINGNIQTLSQITGTENTTRRNFNSGNGRIGIWGASTDTYNIPTNPSMFRVYNHSFSVSEALHNFYVSRSLFGI